MTTLVEQERIWQRPVINLRVRISKRLAWSALTAAVLVICALIGAMLLQALESAAR